MNEKILIKSQHYSLKKFLLIFLAITALVGVLWSIRVYFRNVRHEEQRLEWENSEFAEEIEKARHDYERERRCEHFTEEDYLAGDTSAIGFHEAHPTFESYAKCIGLDLGLLDDTNVYIEALGPWIIVTLFAPLSLNLITLLIWLWLRSYSLTVTDKRVYGKIKFGRRVDLPVDSVSAVATSWLKGISIATSSGRISFLLIKNRDEIHKTLSDLIIARQTKPSVKAEKTTHHSDYTEELKKIKELLDAGIITQEEFDAKKKQLLGL